MPGLPTVLLRAAWPDAIGERRTGTGWDQAAPVDHAESRDWEFLGNRGENPGFLHFMVMSVS